MGIQGFTSLVRRAALPVYALGGVDDQQYAPDPEITFTCIPYNLPYQPHRVTPKHEELHRHAPVFTAGGGIGGDVDPLVRRADVGGQEVVHLLVQEIALLLADVDELPNLVVLFFVLHRLAILLEKENQQKWLIQWLKCRV